MGLILESNMTGKGLILKPDMAPASVPSAGFVGQQLFATKPQLNGLVVGCQTGAGSLRRMQPGRCKKFDGGAARDDLLIVAVSPLTATGSESFWINCASWYETANVYRSGAHYFGYQTGALSFFSGGWYSTAYVPPVNTWLHLVFTHTTGATQLFVNGVLVYSSAVSVASMTGDLSVGCRSDVAFYAIDGKLFDFRAYDSVLSPTEVTALFTLGSAALTNKETLIHLKLDEQHPTIAYDSSGNARHGTYSNHTATVGNFFYEGSDVPFSYQNDGGFTSRENWVPNENWFAFYHYGMLHFPPSLVGTDPVGNPARKLVPDSGTGFKGLAWSLAPPGLGGFTWQCDFKAAEHTIAVLAEGGSGRIGAWFDLASVTANIIAAHAGQIAGIAPLTEGWYRCWVYRPDSLNFDLSMNIGGCFTSSQVTFYAPWMTGDNVSGIIYANPRFYPGKPDGELLATYIVSAQGRVPRDESDRTKDIFGNPLQLVGKCPDNARLIDSPCLTLDGLDDVVTFGDSADLSFTDGVGNDQPFSISCKCRYTAGGTVLSKYGAPGTREWVFGFSVNYFYFGLTDASGTGFMSRYVGPLSTGVDYTITATYTGSKITTGIKIYVNGDLTTSSDYSSGTYSGMSNTAAPVEIGAVTGFLGGPFAGRVWDLRVYSTELTTDEVAWLHDYESGVEPNVADMLRHWPMSEGSGVVIHDTVTENHGTLQNSNLTAAWANKQNGFHYHANKGQSRYGNLAFNSQVPAGVYWGDWGWTTPTTEGQWTRLTTNAEAYGGGWYNSTILPEDGVYSLALTFKAGTHTNVQMLTYDGGSTPWSTGMQAQILSGPGAIAVGGANVVVITGLSPTAETVVAYTFSFSSWINVIIYPGLVGDTPFLGKYLFIKNLQIWKGRIEERPAFIHTWYDWVTTKTYPTTLRPAKANGSHDALGYPLTHPAGAWHNLCQAKVDFSGGVAAPRKDWSRPVNFVDQSGAFVGANWLSQGNASQLPTLTPRFAEAPDGSWSANKIEMNIAGGTFVRIRHAPLLAAQFERLHTASCWLRTLTGTANILLRTGNTNQLCALTTQWRRYSVTGLFATFFPDLQIMLWDAVPGCDAAASILAWGAQIEAGTVAGPYTPNNWSDHGPSDWHPQPPQLFEFQTELENAYWTKSMATMTYNTVVGPDGSLNAGKLTEDTSTNNHELYKLLDVESGTYRFSLFAKAAERDELRLYFYLGGELLQATFNLTSGTKVSSTFDLATIEDAGNGWWHLTVEGVRSTDSVYFMARMLSAGTQVYLGDGASGLLLHELSLKRVFPLNPLFYRQRTQDGLVVRADRVVRYKQLLLDNRLAGAQQFTQTEEL